MARKKDQFREYGGFLLTFEPRRREKIEEKLRVFEEAAESFSAMDWAFDRRELVVLALEPERVSISGIALMERMHGSGGTGKLKMRLSHPVLFDNVITQNEVAGRVSLTELVSTAETLKRIDCETWNELIRQIQKHRPAQAAEVAALLAEREAERPLTGESLHTRRLSEQRDAIGVVLDVAGMDRGEVIGDIDVERIGGAKSVLDILRHEPFHEQDILRHDQTIFGALLEDSMKHVRFEGEHGRAVHIHVYDKKPLETILGIDLLIYLEVYRSFVLIQYKNMDKSGSSWSYLADRQIAKQIEAMEAAEAAIARVEVQEEEMWDWRLYTSPFYFKFCETLRPDTKEDSLIRGIILPLKYLKHFLTLPRSEGSRGGRRVGYDNCPRYFSNTQFLELVREGWIGCDQKGFQFIADLIQAGQDEGREAMLAVVMGKPPEDARNRGRHRH